MTYYVIYREHEKGWGSKDFHATKHDDLQNARTEADKENAKNTAPFAPDYYITARVESAKNLTPSQIEYLEKLMK